MTAETKPDTVPVPVPLPARIAEFVWILIVPVAFATAIAVAYRPEFDTAADVALAALPWITGLGMVAALSGHVVDSPTAVRVVGTAVTLGAWTVLIFADDRWSILSFGIYVVCYSAWVDRPWVGIALSGVASTVWIAAWLAVDAPTWTAIIPLCVFAVGSAMSVSMHRAEVLNAEQRRLIEQLRTTRRDLAVSERSKGILEERSRVAGEIHDTLAQGFTSIVLLSRAAQRSGVSGGELSTIETIAQQNLDASRRLIDAMRPPELERASLQDAVRRHVTSEVGEIPADFRVVGTPRQLPGAVEVTILRAAQELAANVVTHADAAHMDVTLTYLDDAVALDVSDDGAGFAPGTVADRGDLTGGQGLDALARRVESLAGRLTIESVDQHGSVLSVIIPAGGT